MNEARPLGWIIFAIFFLLGLGAFLSPSYTQQMTYAQWFLFAGMLLFIASVVVIVAALGFHTFAFYLLVLTTMALAAFGIYGGVLVIVLTYLTWGLVFSIQLLLVYHNVPTAIAWFKERYTFQDFHTEYRLFYPLLWFYYFILEVIPSFVYHDHLIHFHPNEILIEMYRVLPQKSNKKS